MNIASPFRASGPLPLVFVACLAASFGCSAADSIDNSSDCTHICDRYRECFNQTYDVAACHSRCQARGTSNADDRRVIDTCSACINGLSCTGAAFNCGTQCSSVVP